MKKKTPLFSFLSIFLILFVLCGYAQKDTSDATTWQKTFGGSANDYAWFIQETKDEGYIVVGSTESFGAGFVDVYILKLDANGDLEWQKTFGGSDYDIAFSIQQTKDGGYIAAGETLSFGVGSANVYIIKLDTNGNLEWQKNFGGRYNDIALSIQQTKDGGYIVAGVTEVFVSYMDVYIIKLDARGNSEWQKIFGGRNSEVVYSIQQTKDGGYIVAGWTNSFGAGKFDVYILKLDLNGNLEWEKIYGGDSDDIAFSIQQTSDEGYIVAGETKSFGAGDWDVYILKLDANGNLEWEKIYGGSKNDYARSIQQTKDGGYIVTGETKSFGTGGDVYILKLDVNGNLEWWNTYGGYFEDGAYSIQQTKDGGYIVAGRTESFGTGKCDVYILKLNAKGNTGAYPK